MAKKQSIDKMSTDPAGTEAKPFDDEVLNTGRSLPPKEENIEPLRAIVEELYHVANGGSVAHLRQLVYGAYTGLNVGEAGLLRDKLLRLKSAAEAAAQSGTEAYSVLVGKQG